MGFSWNPKKSVETVEDVYEAISGTRAAPQVLPEGPPGRIVLRVRMPLMNQDSEMAAPEGVGLVDQLAHALSALAICGQDADMVSLLEKATPYLTPYDLMLTVTKGLLKVGGFLDMYLKMAGEGEASATSARRPYAEVKNFPWIGLEPVPYPDGAAQEEEPHDDPGRGAEPGPTAA